MDLQAYFKRINYAASTNPTLETLTAMHRAHLQTVPFENLNIHIPRKIILTEGALFQKIVNENRGGFCFEQNGLFSAVLRELGFDVLRLEANVYHTDTDDYGIPMNHMTLMVIIDGVRYLTDVGFGAAFSEPLEIDNPEIQVQDVGQFKIVIDGNTATYYNHLNNSDKMSIGYRFFFTPHELSDYDEACHYMQTSPKTHFTQKRVCSRMTPEGRISLTDTTLINTTFAGKRTEILVNTEEEYHTILREKFGIDVQTQRPVQIQT